MTLTHFDRMYWPLLWAWMQESPQWHLDDASPTTAEGFYTLLESRLEAGEWLLGVFVNGQPAVKSSLLMVSALLQT